MNLDAAKREIFSHLKKPHHFYYKGSRNQIEEFDGMIIKCFPSIFLIETKDHQIKSFAYSDFIMKHFKILY